ncbi:MAG: hypothetical protein ACR2PM_15905 [Hyphomicrobiales bacterium]
MMRSVLSSSAAYLVVAFAAGSVFLGPSAAADKPTAAEITAAVSDHTYQGSMSTPASTFAEYYAPDGAIRGKGYTGKWRAEDGSMCFQYGDKAERCFGIELQGPSMVMFKDGKIDGNGMLISGNPNKY